jgi:hypothetical protein
LKERNTVKPKQEEVINSPRDNFPISKEKGLLRQSLFFDAKNSGLLLKKKVFHKKMVVEKKGVKKKVEKESFSFPAFCP